MKNLLMIILFLLSFPIYADEDDVKLPEGVSSYEAEENTFNLRPEVIKTFSVACSKAVKIGDSLEVPSSAIVHSLNLVQVFTCTKKGFKPYPVKLIKSDGKNVLVTSENKMHELNVVTSGANYLKTIELFLKEGPAEEEGH